MPVITFDYHDFLTLLHHDLPLQTLAEKLPMIGGDLGSITGDEINIEFFPNRPDLTSVEGIARACRAYFEYTPGLQTYPLTPSTITLTVDPSVKPIRPYVTTALVTNVTMSDPLITSLMGLQEKLHVGLGRNRKKVAIGVHNADAVTPPFTYKAVPPDAISFVPLAKDEPMTLRDILTKHDKGVAYAHLLKDYPKYPIILDAHQNVLSFPPIINGTLTEVTPTTRNIFIDVTGTDRKAITIALNIVATALAERGGQIHKTTVHDEGKDYTSPDLATTKHELRLTHVNTLLGTSFDTQTIIACLRRMGHNTTTLSQDSLLVEIAPWRSDILHEVDLIEDVAVGYGYDQFTMDFPKAMTFGRILSSTQANNALRLLLIGLGFHEVTTFSISNDQDEFKKMGKKPEKWVEIANPIGDEFNGMRLSLLPSMLKLLRENRHHPLPQPIFEVGVVVDGTAKNRWHLAGIKVDAKANFTDCKSIVEAIGRGCGCPFTFTESTDPTFITGRSATIQAHQHKTIGVFGELHPRTIQAFNLEHPCIAFEMNLDELYA